ncbi:MAG: asparagine synthase (glutamine-hydrolyzing) [Lachnospiraceae bacterium]|nr:asparagine synthase (glutamine-hydrolyzing) [Lachnospiraceae bacterium]MBQ8947866.1 asparagine synthase (glutamine-hydrolyzing) [Lachnospiraceae bacterium]
MCGIIGGNNPKWDYKSGIDTMRYRGPDGQRVRSFGDVTFAFARLAIMDLNERAMQPMDSADGLVHIVFNGEIYGFGGIRNELAKEYKFNTTSDTEVILNAYLKYGDSFIDHIDGMFAIALYDERDRRIRLYRDRPGIKPLYYYFQDGEFAFSSELKGIVSLIGEERLDIDDTAICDYLHYQYIPCPKSLFKNVYKLPPAHRLVFDTEQKRLFEAEPYWELKVNGNAARKRTEAEVSDTLRMLIRRSVKDQMVADVPVGTFLSGGVDSSIVTYESSRLKPDICAFTMGFEDKAFDETDYARLMTDRYQLNAIGEILGDKDLKDTKGKLKEWYDEPFADTSAYPTYRVSALAKKHVTVVLTGDGGDELFGGYDRYERYLNYLKSPGREWRTVKQLVKYILRYGGITNRLAEVTETAFNIYKREQGMNLLYPNPAVSNYLKQYDVPDDYDRAWYYRQYWDEDLPPMTRVRYLDFKTYMHDAVLTKVDRVSMQVSLESRVPLLSKEIIEYAFSLSSEECCPGSRLKECLKQAYINEIPGEILYRPKMGFGVPYEYMRNEMMHGHMWLGVLINEWGI